MFHKRKQMMRGRGRPLSLFQTLPFIFLGGLFFVKEVLMIQALLHYTLKSPTLLPYENESIMRENNTESIYKILI